MTGDAGELKGTEIKIDRIAIGQKTGNAKVKGDHFLCRLKGYPMSGMRCSMDYNRTTMSETPDARSRRRLTLIVITLATIPCYCIGWIAMALAPDAGQLTPTATITLTSAPTETGTLAIQSPTLSLTPLIV